jgi:hypothetical protein
MWVWVSLCVCVCVCVSESVCVYACVFAGLDYDLSFLSMSVFVIEFVKKNLFVLCNFREYSVCVCVCVCVEFNLINCITSFTSKSE